MTNNPPNKKTASFLFVCYGNACRSPIAEGLAKRVLGEQIRIESAGLTPILDGATHDAIEVLHQVYDIDISHHAARGVADVPMDLFEHIIVLDAYVFETLKNLFPSLSDRFTLWDIEDPYGKGNRAFKKTAKILKNLIEKRLLSHDSK